MAASGEALSSREMAQSGSPFLDAYLAVPIPDQAKWVSSESPFLNEYLAGNDEESPPDAQSQLYATVLNELEDEGMQEALYALVDEASDVAASHSIASRHAAHDIRVERALREHFAPLVVSAEALIDSAALRAETLDLSSVGEGELDEAFEGFEPEHRLATPAFEQFFGALKRKLKKVASAAKGLVKKGIALAGGPLLKLALSRLRALVRPLLDKVLKIALDKVPEQYRPLALTVAQKLGIKLPSAVSAALGGAAAGADPPTAGMAQSLPSTEPSAPDPGVVQQELDLRLTEALLAQDAAEFEQYQAEPVAATRDPLTDLDRAREQFVRELLEAGDSSEAGPIVESFLPAIMLALRTGIKLIGRAKVVSFLGGLIGKFIAPFVGKAAPALGNVLADMGLRTVLQAEVTDGEQRQIAAETLAGVVEDTVRRVAALPQEAFEQPELGEALMYEAFQAAAAASFPAERVQAELRETETGGWIHLPLRGQRQYKKFGRVFDVALSPHAAAGLTTYGGGTVADFLRDRLRLPATRPIAARVHLYEAIPRTRLARIARAESVRGLGSSEPGAWSQLHPLTHEAASVLTGSPQLGRQFDDNADRRETMIGERYYFLEIPAAPARPVGHETHLHLTVDLPRAEIRVCVYLSESLAQRVATALRKQGSPAEIIAMLRAALRGHGQTASSSAPTTKVRIRLGHPQADAAHRAAPGIGRGATALLRRQIRVQVMAWTWLKLSEFFAKGAADFIAKTDGPEDGVRLAVTFQSPDGLSTLRRAFSGQATATSAWTPNRVPAARIEVKAGPKHD